MDQIWSNLEFRVGPLLVQGGPDLVQGGPLLVQGGPLLVQPKVSSTDKGECLRKTFGSFTFSICILSG